MDVHVHVRKRNAMHPMGGLAGSIGVISARFSPAELLEKHLHVWTDVTTAGDDKFAAMSNAGHRLWVSSPPIAAKYTHGMMWLLASKASVVPPVTMPIRSERTAI